MFTLPSVPTDNLYKFFSIFGLVIGTSIFIYTQIKEQELELEVASYKIEEHKFKLAEDELGFVQKDLENETAAFHSTADKGTPYDTTSLSIIHVVNSPNSSIEKWSIELSERIRKYHSDKELIKSRALDLSERNFILDSHKTQLNQLFFYRDILFSVAIVFVFGGFALWYFKIQRYQDALLYKDYLDALKK